MITGQVERQGALDVARIDFVLERISIIEERILIIEYALSALSKRVDELASERG